LARLYGTKTELIRFW